MKKLATTLASLALAASAAAHTAALPHSHHGNETNWLPAFAIIATLVVATLLIAGFRKRSRKRD